MTSAKKIEANRANAQKSTGPTTEHGKLLSRYNAMKQFGVYATQQILPGENPDAYSARMRQLFDTYEPVGPLEKVLCMQLVHGMWRLIRLQWAELAALKRSMVTVAVNSARYRDGCPAASEDDIDYSLNSVLAQSRRPLPTDASEAKLPNENFKLDDLPNHVSEVNPPSKSAGAENLSGDASKTTPPSESVNSGDESKFFVLECDPPPNGMTLLKSYASGETNKLCLEIDSQVRAVTKHMLRLHAALEVMQERRKALGGRAAENN